VEEALSNAQADMDRRIKDMRKTLKEQEDQMRAYAHGLQGMNAQDILSKVNGKTNKKDATEAAAKTAKSTAADQHGNHEIKLEHPAAADIFSNPTLLDAFFGTKDQAGGEHNEDVEHAARKLHEKMRADGSVTTEADAEKLRAKYEQELEDSIHNKYEQILKNAAKGSTEAPPQAKASQASDNIGDIFSQIFAGADKEKQEMFLKLLAEQELEQRNNEKNKKSSTKDEL